jgi:hypothetical protein
MFFASNHITFVRKCSRLEYSLSQVEDAASEATVSV